MRCFFFSPSAVLSAACSAFTGSPRSPTIIGSDIGMIAPLPAVMRPPRRKSSSWLRKKSANSARPVLVRCTVSLNQRVLSGPALYAFQSSTLTFGYRCAAAASSALERV